MIITISGTPGSGKSTLATLLAEKLGYKRYYMGALLREVAKKHNLKLRELLELGEREAWVDSEIDEYQKKLGQREDNFVIEGRTSFLMIPHSFKVFITVDEIIGAERVFNHLKTAANERNEDYDLNTVQAVLLSHRKRMATDTKRYYKYYQTAVFDPSNYDFVLDTTNLTINEGFEQLYRAVMAQQKKVARTAD